MTTIGYAVAASLILVTATIWLVLLIVAARADGREERERDHR
jgi:hypothetical protein